MPRRPETQMPRYPDQGAKINIIYRIDVEKFIRNWPRCPDAQTITNSLILFEILINWPRCPDVKKPRCPDAQKPRCPDAQTPRNPDAQTPETQMPRPGFPDEYKYPDII